MEIIFSAIFTAITVGGAAGIAKVSSQLAVDSYQSLKGLLTNKLGADSKAIEAIEKLEEDPYSAGWKETVSKELGKENITDDPLIIAAAQSLLDELKSLPGGEQRIKIIGDYNAVATDQSTAAVNVNHGTKQSFRQK